MSDDLIKRLRGLDTYGYQSQLACEAADLIASQQAEIERLREALRVIQSEAERENGSWVHLKRCIYVHAKTALASLAQKEP